MIASHYAEPVERHLLAAGVLRVGPSPEAVIIGELGAGSQFALLDDTLGWAWGYAGAERRVGYIESAKIAS